MESMVEENGNSTLDIDPLSESVSVATSVQQQQQQQQQASEGGVSSQQQQQQTSTSTATILTTAPNIVQFIQTPNIQANQSSVIQTAAANIQPVTINKAGILYVNKNNSVIHAAPGIQVQTFGYSQIKPEPTSLSQIHSNDTNSDDSFSDDDSPKRRRDLLTRRPSYHRILKDITGPDIAVLPATSLQFTNIQGTDGLHAIQTSGSGGTIVQYTSGQNQDGQQFYVPVMGNAVLAEDQSRKREIRLQKNREAARECRRKKKEYIKCLENRVAVLENQNKALIEELKALKELYCQQKSD